MATTIHTEVFDQQTEADFARIESDAAAAAEVVDPREWYLSIIVMERKDDRGWDIIVKHETREGDEDKTTRVCMSRDEVARVIAQEIEDAE